MVSAQTSCIVRLCVHAAPPGEVLASVLWPLLQCCSRVETGCQASQAHDRVLNCFCSSFTGCRVPSHLLFFSLFSLFALFFHFISLFFPAFLYTPRVFIIPIIAILNAHSYTEKLVTCFMSDICPEFRCVRFTKSSLYALSVTRTSLGKAQVRAL